MSDWLVSNSDRLVGLVGVHVALVLVPVVIAAVIAVPLGLALSGRVGAGSVVTPRTTGYVLPVLVLLVLFQGMLGDDRLSTVGIVVALAVPTTVLLTRQVIAGVRNVPGDVRRGAVGVGYGRVRRQLRVELPMAAPSIFAALRMAAVANVSVVTLAALVGGGGLGTLFLESYREEFATPAITGLVLTLLLAALADRGVRGLQWLTVPWERGVSA